MFFSDKAIDSYKSDILNRAFFSKQLAKAISSYKNTDNLTIGLSGKWGCGKTSIINMVVNELKDSSKNDPIIINFNPWNYHDSNQLLSQFFKTVIFEIEDKDKNETMKSVGEALQKYSAIFEYTTYIPVIGQYLTPIKELVLAVGKQISEVADERLTLSKQKEIVSDLLKSQNKKLLVIIDDIDRLNNEQIRFVFQMVNSLVDFPNMIYILSYDKDVVVRALEKEQKCDGSEYLEKIVQIPIDVPVAKKELIYGYLFDKVEKIFKNIPNDNYDENYWFKVFSNCVEPFIDNIRDINRILNVYLFKYGLLYEETNCVDLFALTTLQVQAPSIYKWISDEIKYLTAIDVNLDEDDNKKAANKNAYISEFETVYPDNPYIMLNVIQTIFPKVSYQIGNSNIIEEDLQLKHDLRVASSDRIDFYFRLSLEQVIISRDVVKASVFDYNAQELKAFIYSLFFEETILEYLSELKTYYPYIPKERLPLFFNELMTCYISLEDMSKSFAVPKYTEFELRKCSLDILKMMDRNIATTLFASFIDKSYDNKSVIKYADILLSVERHFGRIPGKRDDSYEIIDENSLSFIEKKMLKRIEIVIDNMNLIEIIKYNDFCILWEHLGKSSFDNYIETEISKLENIIKYIQSLLIECGRNENLRWRFQKKKMSNFIIHYDLYQQIKKFKCTRNFSSLSTDLKLKIIAYCYWYENGCIDNDEVSLSKVRKILPKWEVS